MANKTVIVTGASGFIGTAVVKKLANKYKVIAVFSPFSKASRQGVLPKNVLIQKVDLSKTSSTEKLFKKYKPFAVLHLATHGVYQYQQKDGYRIVLGNYFMSLNLLELSKIYKVKKFINTGSVFEYGSQNKKVKESDVRLNDILNQYSASKMATTALANSFTEDLEVITLRPFTTYGELEDESRFIKNAIQKALAGEEIKIVSGVIRDFVYADDVADAYLKALNKTYTSGEIINIAGGNKINLEEAAKLIVRITKSKSKIIFDNTYKRSKDSACWADISRAKKVLGWKPKLSLLQGLRRVIYYLEHDN